MSLSNMSAAELARAIDVTQQAVGRWLRDEVDDVMSHHLFHAADAMKVDARWLATGQGSPRPEREGLPFVGALIAEKIGKKSESSQRLINEIIERLD